MATHLRKPLRMHGHSAGCCSSADGCPAKCLIFLCCVGTWQKSIFEGLGSNPDTSGRACVCGKLTTALVSRAASSSPWERLSPSPQWLSQGDLPWGLLSTILSDLWQGSLQLSAFWKLREAQRGQRLYPTSNMWAWEPKRRENRKKLLCLASLVLGRQKVLRMLKCWGMLSAEEMAFCSGVGQACSQAEGGQARCILEAT